MKRNFFIALFMMCAGLMFAQPMATESIERPAEEKEKGEIVFIRATGYSGCLMPFKAFVDDDLVCRINNRRFSKHKIEEGKHQFSVQYYGKERKAKYTPVDIEIQGGQKHYIMLIQKLGFFQNKLIAVEISEASAKDYMKRIKLTKEDKKY